METKIEARVTRTSLCRGRASIHITFDPESGLTVSNIEVREEGGKLAVKMPPPGRRPDITFQGSIKRQIEEAVKRQYQAAEYNPARTAWR